MILQYQHEKAAVKNIYMCTWYCLLGLALITSDKAKNSRERAGREGERALSEEAVRQLAMKMR